MRLPESDRFSITREKLKADIAVAMGGRVAEVLIFGYDKVTTGASSDIQQATKMARAMVTEWGMSDKIGPLFHGGEQSDMYGGGGSNKARSEEIANLIDSEVKELVEEGYVLAEKILKKHLDGLHLLAKTLLEYETLTGTEIKDLLAGKGINRPLEEDAEQAPKSTFDNKE